MTPASTQTALMVVVAAAGLMTHACAPSRAGVPRARPVVAPAAPATAAAAPRRAAIEESPTRLLSRGFKRYEQGDYGAAVEAFSAAIGTGSLNDAGRALAYWQIATAERHLQHEDRSLEALSSFVVVAEDLLDPDGEPHEFVASFRLPKRMAEARAFISAAWARRVPEFGRSAAYSIPVHSEEEVEQFLGFAAVCAGAPDRRVDRSAVQGGRRLERVTVSCASRRVNEEYFLRHVATPAAAVTARSGM